MEIWERDIVKTLVERDGFPIGSKGVVVYVYEEGPACEVEIWNEKNYPVDVVFYYFNELELVKRTKESIKVYNGKLHSI